MIDRRRFKCVRPQAAKEEGADRLRFCDTLGILDPFDNPVDFISHGGAIVGGPGPLMGLTSTDIGLVEDETTPATNSLQLTGGPGSSVTDFTWAAGPASLGAFNAGQTF